MAFDLPSRSGVRGQVNITPLIDVVLVLLIIFMVMTPTTMKHMKSQLAREAVAAPPPTAEPVLVEVGTTGVVVDGEATPWSGLFQRVRDRLLRSRQSAVFFKIADDVEYGEAVRVMDLCRGAGAQVIALPGSRG
jgi:biopolymer transport protein ExbD